MERWYRHSAPAHTRSAAAVPLPGLPVPALVLRARAGDAEAFAQLYNRYVGDVYAFVAVRLPDRESAEDVTQAIFMRALQSLATCREASAFPGWLFAIARNMVTDYYRAERGRAAPLDESLELTDPQQTPEEVILQRDDARLLATAREVCLSAADQELFDLLLTDMNDKQIAQALGRTHGAVRTAHYRLMIRLRDCLARLTERGRGSHADL
ncbi:MAG: sigma-70 family RNA polymerase sigma factor [Thermomicrobiales bacterium]|nr:sigma-70 family RNA polymerase sigma factor [Thermomicrobiales bacterium]